MLGQGSQRFQFFSELFRLDSYDSIRVVLEQGRAALKDEQAVLVAQEQELSTLTTEIAMLRDKTEKWQGSALDEARDHIQEVRERQARIEVLREQGNDLADKGCNKVAYTPKAHKNADKAVEELEYQLTLYLEYGEWAKEHKKAQRKAGELKMALAKIPEVKPRERKKIDTTIAQAHEIAEKVADVAKALANLQTRRPQVVVSDKRMEELRQAFRTDYDCLAHARLVLQALKVSTDDKCPVCGSKYTATKKMVRQQEEVVQRFEESLPKSRKAYEEAHEAQCAHNDAILEIAQLEKDIKKLKSRQDKNASKLAAALEAGTRS